MSSYSIANRRGFFIDSAEDAGTGAEAARETPAIRQLAPSEKLS